MASLAHRPARPRRTTAQSGAGHSNRSARGSPSRRAIAQPRPAWGARKKSHASRPSVATRHSAAPSDYPQPNGKSETSSLGELASRANESARRVRILVQLGFSGTMSSAFLKPSPRTARATPALPRIGPVTILWYSCLRCRVWPGGQRCNISPESVKYCTLSPKKRFGRFLTRIAASIRLD
jgi:hypothetical protein